MNYIEILEYSKRCAEFLGAVYHDDDKTSYSEGYWLLDSLDFDLPSQLKDMEGFYYDWNWIMYLVDKIQERYNEDYYITSKINFVIAKNCLNKNTTCEISLEGRFKPEISICTENFDKRQAVVEAINDFLIWYNQNTKKI